MVNAGNFAAPNRRIRLVDLPIQRRKAELIMDGLSVAPIPLTAMGVGERDLLMGGKWLIESLESRQIPHVLSNVVCDGIDFVESRIHSVEGFRLSFWHLCLRIFKGRVNGDLRSVSSMLPQCTACSIDWLVEHPQQTSTVVFADLNRNDIGTLSPYADIVIESKIGRTTAGPEGLDAKSVLIGVGSKVVGTVSWTYRAHKAGFGSVQSKETKLRDLEQRQVRLQNLNKDIESTSDPFEQNKLQRQIEYTEQSIARVEAELLAIPMVEDSVMEISTDSLNRSIPNFEEIEELIEKAQTDIKQLSRG